MWVLYHPQEKEAKVPHCGVNGGEKLCTRKQTEQ